MRAVAVLLVVASHAFPSSVPAGFIGVDIFFVISGYLISTIILNGLKNDRFSYLDFYSRRIRRIFPALLIVLVTFLVAGWFLLFADEYQGLGEHTAGGAAFIANLLYFKESGYFDINRDYKPLLHLWSLGVEEQYYLVWPLFLGLVYRRTHRSLRVILSLLLLSFVCDVVVTAYDPSASYFLPVTRFWQLMVGSLLAYVHVFRHDLEPEAMRGAHAPLLREALSWCGVGLLLAALVLIRPTTPYPGWWALLPTLGAAAFIAAGPGTLFNRWVLAWRPMVLIGLISYPLYLWHWPLLSFARIIWNWPTREARFVAVGAAVGLAWLTFRLFEKPIRSSRRPATVWALLAGMTVTAASGLAIYAQGGLPSRPIETSKQAAVSFLDASLHENSLGRDKMAADAAHCADQPISDQVKARCFSYGEHSSAPILIWGDSHSWSWRPAFLEIGRQLGVEVINIVHAGCPPLIDVKRPDGSGFPTYCQGAGMGEDIVHAIAAIKPQRIFLICRWSLYAAPDFLELDSKTGTTMRPGNSVFDQQLQSTIRELAAIAPVTIVRTTPSLKTEARRGLLRDLPLQPTIEEYRNQEKLADAGIDAALQGLQNVDAFDPADLLCGKVCAVVLDRTLVYVDDNHMTFQGALLFKPSLMKAYFSRSQTDPH